MITAMKNDLSASSELKIISEEAIKPAKKVELTAADSIESLAPNSNVEFMIIV